MDLALYRKYRPAKFADVLDQEHITEVLSGALELGRTAHAYLFAGPRGTGKTSVARILAREVGCTESDLREIDAASNRGIDEIRALKEEVRTMPFESKVKVYIIDEVHMLTREAFNALLKTLEEPPAHAMFILATTDLHKVPDTIVSRCQSFTFKKPTQEVLRSMIQKVVKKEGYQMDKESVNLIALLGDGSFRDTQGVLQKILSMSREKKISIEDVRAVTNAPRSSMVYEFVEALLAKNTEAAVTVIQGAAEANIDMKVFIKLVLRIVRFVMLAEIAPSLMKKISVDLTEDELAFIEKHRAEKNVTVLAGILRELLGTHEEIDRAAVPSLPLELAVVKLGN